MIKSSGPNRVSSMQWLHYLQLEFYCTIMNVCEENEDGSIHIGVAYDEGVVE